MTPRTLCDGSDDLRLMVAVVGGGRIAPGNLVLYDNGSFIAVDGHCRFWVKPAESEFEEIRTGILDADTLAEFVADFRYDYWPALPSTIPSGVPIFDAADLVFLDPEVHILCRSGCLGERTPPEIVAMSEAHVRWNARLWAAGEAVTGDVRISVVESGRAPEFLPATWVPSPWPASVPIESIAVSELDGSASALDFGDGVLLTGADAEALRMMRSDFLSTGPVRRGIPSILIRNGDGPVYFVQVRDTIPFEDEHGLIPMLHRWPG